MQSIPRILAGVVLCVVIVAGCSSSSDEAKPLPTTTAPAATIPGLPVANAKTCGAVPKNQFVAAGAGKIIDVKAQTGVGQVQSFSFATAICTFRLDDDTSVSVGVLFDATTTKAFGADEFERYRDQTNGTSTEPKVAKAAFVLRGPITDKLVALGATNVFTVEATRDGTAVDRSTLARLSQAAIDALS